VQGEQQDRLKKLAAQVAAESDPKKFQALLHELNRLLTDNNFLSPTNGKSSLPPPTH
jgi:hypothetical protein